MFQYLKSLEQRVEVMKVTQQERVSERMGEDIMAVVRIICPERWKRAGGEHDF